jgi:hypothetical protein
MRSQNQALSARTSLARRTAGSASSSSAASVSGLSSPTRRAEISRVTVAETPRYTGQGQLGGLVRGSSRLTPDQLVSATRHVDLDASPD